MTVDELREYFEVKTDKALASKMNISPSTICKWRKEGINYVRQESIQLQTKNVLVARIEDSTAKAKEV